MTRGRFLGPHSDNDFTRGDASGRKHSQDRSLSVDHHAPTTEKVSHRPALRWLTWTSPPPPASTLAYHAGSLVVRRRHASPSPTAASRPVSITNVSHEPSIVPAAVNRSLPPKLACR